MKIKQTFLCPIATQPKIVRGPKNPNTTWGRPKQPLAGLHRRQLQERLRPIIDQFEIICKEWFIDK